MHTPSAPPAPTYTRDGCAIKRAGVVVHTYESEDRARRVMQLVDDLSAQGVTFTINALGAVEASPTQAQRDALGAARQGVTSR